MRCNNISNDIFPFSALNSNLCSNNNNINYNGKKFVDNFFTRTPVSRNQSGRYSCKRTLEQERRPRGVFQCGEGAEEFFDGNLKLEEKVKALTEENNQLKLNLKETKQIQEENKKLKENLKIIENFKEQLKEKETLKIENDKLKRYIEEKAKVKEKYTLETKERMTFLSKESSKILSLKEKLKKVQSEHQKSLKAVARLEKEKSDFEFSLLQKKEAVKRKEEAIKKLQVENDDLKKKLKHYKGQEKTNAVELLRQSIDKRNNVCLTEGNLESSQKRTKNQENSILLTTLKSENNKLKEVNKKNKDAIGLYKNFVSEVSDFFNFFGEEGESGLERNLQNLLNKITSLVERKSMNEEEEEKWDEIETRLLTVPNNARSHRYFLNSLDEEEEDENDPWNIAKCAAYGVGKNIRFKGVSPFHCRKYSAKKLQSNNYY